MKKLSLILRLIAAGILFQTLYFKFSGAPESIYIFTKLNVEPWGRLLAGGSELVAGILLCIPATQVLGALAGLGIISGALLSHIAILGIEVQGDGGLLFTLALIVFICCLGIIYINRQSLIQWVNEKRGMI